MMHWIFIALSWILKNEKQRTAAKQRELDKNLNPYEGKPCTIQCYRLWADLKRSVLRDFEKNRESQMTLGSEFQRV